MTWDNFIKYLQKIKVQYDNYENYLIVINKNHCYENILIYNLIKQNEESVWIREIRHASINNNFDMIFCLVENESEEKFKSKYLNNNFVISSIQRFNFNYNFNENVLNILLNYPYKSLSDIINPFSMEKIPNSSMFYGRDKELKSINESTNNIAIIGPRRIGKTSLGYQLLNSVNKISVTDGLYIKKTTLNPVIMMDISSLSNQEDIFKSMLDNFGYDESLYLPYSRKINDKSEYFNSITELVKNRYPKQLTIIFDEVDYFLLLDKQNNYRIFNKIRNIIDNNDAKLIMIGYEFFSNELYNDKFPLYGRITEVKLRPIDKNATEHLILNTLKHLNIEINPAFDNFVDRMWKITYGFPHLIQGICSTLISSLLTQSKFEINQNDFFACINNNPNISIFKNSLLSNGNLLCKIICYLSAIYMKENSIKRIESYTLIKLFEINQAKVPKELDFKYALDNLDLRYIFIRIDDSSPRVYKFSNYDFLELYYGSYKSNGDKNYLKLIINEYNNER